MATKPRSGDRANWLSLTRPTTTEQPAWVPAALVALTTPPSDPANQLGFPNAKMLVNSEFRLACHHTEAFVAEPRDHLLVIAEA